MIDRRHFIKAAALSAGGMTLSPLARSLGQTIRAAESGAPPLRFVFFLQGNGMEPEQIQPGTILRPAEPSALEDRALAGHQLPTSLEPLQPFADRMTLLHGLSGRVTGPPLHSADFGALGCFPQRQGVYAETIDGALAKALPGIFPHIGLGVSEFPNDSVIYNVSAWGRGKALPTQCQPGIAYQRLFASAGDGDARRAFDARSKVLDFLADDVRRLKTQLNQNEKEKLDYYLDAFESMETRQTALAAASERIVESGRRIDPGKLPRGAGGFAHLDAHLSIAATSLIAGLSSVATISSGSGMEFLGIKIDGEEIGIAPGPIGLHGVGHGGGYGGKSSDELLVAIRQRHAQSLANFLDQLDAVPEGDGTMLDNTLVIYMSDQAEGHHPKCFEWPIIVIGDLGKRLATRGRYLRYPWYGNLGHRTIGSFYTTLLHAAGAPRDRFGLDDKILGELDQEGPLDELLT